MEFDQEIFQGQWISSTIVQETSNGPKRKILQDSHYIRASETFEMLELPKHNKDYAIDEFDTLTGRIGIGLSLLAGVSTVDPEWDRLLVSSI